MVINWDGIITYFIYNELFDETYTAHIQKNGKDWEGSIVELPEIECVAETAVVVQKQLPNILQDILVAKEAAWDQKLKEDMEAGKLAPFIMVYFHRYRLFFLGKGCVFLFCCFFCLSFQPFTHNLLYCPFDLAFREFSSLWRVFNGSLSCHVDHLLRITFLISLLVIGFLPCRNYQKVVVKN